MDLARESTRHPQGAHPKAWLPQAEGIPLDSAFIIPLLTQSTIRTALTVDLEPSFNDLYDVFETARDTRSGWRMGLERLYFLFGHRIRTISEYAPTEESCLQDSTLHPTLAVGNFVRKVEHLITKAEGWYEDLIDLEITSISHFQQQSAQADSLRFGRQMDWWTPKDIRESQKDFRSRLRTMSYTKDFDAELYQSIMDEFRVASENFDNKHEAQYI
ncbi:MAG: hypothetical protein Q9199_002303 [Rusavskia elegans]